MKRVLIISSEPEFYYFRAFIEAAKKTRHLDIVVFDTLGFPSDRKIAIKMSDRGVVNGFIDILRPDTEGSDATETIDIDSIEVAWNLRAHPSISKHMKSDVDLKFSINKSAFAMNALQLTAPWRWINKRKVIKTVEDNKLYQQKVATASGLLVPETLVSNDPTAVSAFAIKNGELLLKTFGHPDVVPEGNFCYSNLFTAEEINAHSRAIQECPIFSQLYILKKFEYRVMVIGQEILACRIDSQASEKTRIDWRHYDFDHVTHESAVLPKHVNEALIRFMERIDLQYGAIDMIETADGEFVFLEVNPSGQWGWIHHFAKLPIPDAVARMLTAA